MLAWSCAALLLTAWSAWFFWSDINVVEVSRAARVEVQQSASPVVAQTSGKIAGTTLSLGQEVHAGDILVRLDASAEELRLREEESRLKAFAPRITSLNAEIAAMGQASAGDRQTLIAAAQAAQFRTVEAGAAVEFAKDNERRMKEESSAGSVAQIDALRATAEAKKLTATRDSLAADARRIESDAKTRGLQHQVQLENLRRAIVTLEGERKTSEAAIARLKYDIDKRLIRAPIAGRIGDVAPLRLGAYLPEGQKLASVVPNGTLMIVADFAPGAALGRIQPGQLSSLRLDGFPWSQFGSVEARVTRVASEIRDQQVRVEFTPIAPLPSKIVLQHGLPGTISVSLERASPARMVLRAVGQLAVNTAQQPVTLGAVRVQ
jgi:membrane fusion protein, adhesin transport system